IDYVLSTWTIPFFGIGLVSSFLAFHALYEAYRRTGSATPFLGWLFAGVLLMMSGTFFPWVPVFKQYTVVQLSYSLGCILLIRPVLQQNLFNPIVELHRLAEEKAKALSAASEAKTEFLSMMSHDLRTPLQTITMLSQFMERPDNYPGTTLSPAYQDDV